MSNTIYVPVSVDSNDLPEKDGPVYTITPKDPNQLGQWYYKAKGFNYHEPDEAPPTRPVTHWLKPIPAEQYASQLVGEKEREVEEMKTLLLKCFPYIQDMQADNISDPSTGCFYDKTLEDIFVSIKALNSQSLTTLKK